MAPPLGRQELRWARTRRRDAAGAGILADAIIERYYNFGGEGILAGRRWASDDARGQRAGDRPPGLVKRCSIGR